MMNIAILGFGVVGSGVASFISANAKEILAQGGDSVSIKYILDLRDFPDSPFADRIVHSYDVIASDPEIDCIIEVMGGAHPAYEYTTDALSRGVSVITSNKEVVALHGDEFMALAEKSGACYRFEAAVGGGIPVLSPIISLIRQNKMREVRGILNGTTNYILTQMFTYGESFESALADAQAKGYAERNPDADVLGIDAARKITILTALATDKLVDVNRVHTEGITGIRGADVAAAASLGKKIKLVGRCIVEEGGAYVMVAPFMIDNDAPLGLVDGVYNAVEVIADPLENVMFYGQGAGSGTTASAVVGDLMQIMRSGRKCKMPIMERSESTIIPFATFKSASYIALDKSQEAEAKKIFGEVEFIREGDEIALVTECLPEGEIELLISRLSAAPKSRIRLL